MTPLKLGTIKYSDETECTTTIGLSLNWICFLCGRPSQWSGWTLLLSSNGFNN